MRANGEPPPVAEAVCDGKDWALSDGPTIHGMPGEPGFRREPPASPDCPSLTGAELFWQWHDARGQFQMAAMASDNLNELTRLQRRVTETCRKVTKMAESVKPALVDVGFGYAVEFTGPPLGFRLYKIVPGGLVAWPPEEGAP